jgi:pre-rRNA-processing protein TSR1
MRHSPGTLKQTNKTHKVGRHQSKGAISKNNKGNHWGFLSIIYSRLDYLFSSGRVAPMNLAKKSLGKMNRVERKNYLNQLKKCKREEVINKKRSVGTLTGTPHIIVSYNNNKNSMIINKISI